MQEREQRVFNNFQKKKKKRKKKKQFAAQGTIERNISWPNNYLVKNFMGIYSG